MRTHLLSLLLVVTLSGGSAFPATRNCRRAAPHAQQPRIPSRNEYLVVLKDQADLSGASSIRNPAERVRWVVDHLRTVLSQESARLWPAPEPSVAPSGS